MEDFSISIKCGFPNVVDCDEL
nr:hypothetical protein [Sicyoidochytrium minutum DNA virus]